MYSLRTFHQLTTASLMAMALAACSGNSTIESDLGISGAPDWVNEGTQAVNDDEGRMIQGIGMAPTMGDMSLQKTTADTRARAEIARIVSSYLDTTLNDYTASAGGQLDASVEREIRSKTKLALNGSKIKGRWKNEDTGNIFSFAEMDMSALDDAISAAAAMSDGFQKYYQQQANSGFARFVEEKQ